MNTTYIQKRWKAILPRVIADFLCIQWSMMAALGVGVALVLIGRFVPALHWLYDYAWFVGFFVSGTIYVALMRGAVIHSPVPELAGEKI